MSSQSYTAKDDNRDQAMADTAQPEKKTVKSKKSASAFRTISEVANHLGVQQHVLRFWETKFSHVRPLKRGGGRRYYRPEDIALLETIHHLLYTEGYTIKGVQKLLKEKGKNKVVQNNMPSANPSVAAPMDAPRIEKSVTKQEEDAVLGRRDKFLLESVLGDLKDLKNLLVAKR